MLVAREEQHLVAGLAEIAEHHGRGLGALGVEVHQHVVEYQRQWHPPPRETPGQGQAQGEEQLLARAAAQRLDRQRSPFGRVHHQHVLVQRGPHAHIAPFGQPGEILRGFKQGLWLAVFLVVVLQLLEDAAADGQYLPAPGSLGHALLEAAEFQLLSGERAVGCQRVHLFVQRSALLIAPGALGVEALLFPAQLLSLLGKLLGWCVLFEQAADRSLVFGRADGLGDSLVQLVALLAQ